jgi:DNA-binding transcriptional regulator YdaS (Cro superfamily)
MTKVSSEKEALQRAATVLGGRSAMAKLLGYQDHRSLWPYFQPDRHFPAEHCPTIELATRAEGKVVTCEELRPDVNWSVLRKPAKPVAQLAQQPAARKGAAKPDDFTSIDNTSKG